MANDVFANGREVSCKAASGKSICAFPDVCFTPPQTPATPPGVPIPNPNTGMGSDTSKGSRNVKISGKEVMLKNKSMFKKSMGDQAGCAPKKGVVTSQTGGKVYFNSWSMDVKIEGENAVRHLDLTTHNHGSVPGNTPTWPYIDSAAFATAGHEEDACEKDQRKEQAACAEYKPYKEDGKDACENFQFKPAGDNKAASAMEMANDAAFNDPAKDCLNARTCQLVPYEAKGDQAKCCHGQTGHHLVEAAAFHRTGRGTTATSKLKAIDIVTDEEGNYTYSAKQAPCVCVFGTNQYHGTHGLMHAHQGASNAKLAVDKPLTFLDKTETKKAITYAQARDSSVAAVGKVHTESSCEPGCLKAQLDAYHKAGLGMEDGDYVKSVETGYTDPNDLADADKISKNKLKRSADSDATGGRFSKRAKRR